MIVRPKYRGPDLPTTLAVAMTAGAATGVEVAHSTEYDLAATSFTLPINIALPDYTPAADQWLYFKYQDASNYWGLRVKTSGVLNFIAVTGGVTRLDIDSTASVSVTNGLKLWGAISVTRESASVAGSALFTINGSALGTTVAITAGAPPSLSNTGSLYIAGTNAAGTESTLRSAYPYNRALSADEVLSLCNNGVAAADVGASQASAVSGSVLNGTSNRAFSTFSSGADNFTGTTLAGDSSLNYAGYSIAVSLGQKIRVKGTFSITGTLGSAAFRINIAASLSDSAALSNTVTVSGTSGDFDVVLTATSSATGIVNFSLGTSPVTSATITVTSIAINRLGCTLQLDPSGLAASGLTWTDSSGNGNNGTLPAAGATKVSIRK